MRDDSEKPVGSGPRGHRTPVPATATVVALLAVVAACSSSPPPPSSQPLNQSLANTSWFGTCAGLDVGTYTFEFGPAADGGGGTAPGGAGTVKVGFPNAAKGVQEARYSTAAGRTGEQELVVELSPPWRGAFSRDRKNLRWNPVIGNSGAPAQCFLEDSGATSGR